jgi:hypothetical protein
MHAKPGHSIQGPAAWTGDELSRDHDWIWKLSAAELTEIDDAVRHAKALGKPVLRIDKEDFPLPSFAQRLRLMSDEMESGRGFVLLRGLPHTYTREDMEFAYWGIGTHLGTAVTQGGRGELLGLVQDEGGASASMTKIRHSKTTLRIRVHADRADWVGLLCVRKAKSGGASLVVSAAAIHNAILERRPDLIDVFYNDVYHSRQGDQAPGESPAYPKPMFGFRDGYFAGQFSPLYVRTAQEFPEVPRLTPQQKEALEVFEALAHELALSMDFEPGDMQFLNNHLTYHSRTAFEDHSEPERKRLLLRLWLAPPNSRPLPQGYELLWGSIEPGVVRGGVPSKYGWRDIHAMRAHEDRQKSAAVGS